MAQAATMGPPLSPREPRRSGRRSIPSTSTSASKSPDSDPAPRQKEITHRPPLSSTNSGARQKRLKQEDCDDPPEEQKNGSAASTPGSSTHGATNGRNKRRAKENKQIVDVPIEGPTGIIGNPLIDAPEEEEQGITRCVCGSTGEDDPDAGEFMVQCETCKVWQHGLCMGYESEDQLHEDDYYCEQCRPELHPDIHNRKRSKRPRQTSTNSHLNPASVTSRVSRSHSPSTLLKQPSKRRNTMNSRDAAFDQSLKEIIEATAAEAAAQHDNISVTSTGNHDLNGTMALDEEVERPSGRKKRKRSEDDGTTKKRPRSASCNSDHLGSIITPDEAPGKNLPVSAPPPRPSGRSNKRGGRKTAPAPAPLDSLALMDGEEGLPTGSRRQGNSRAKGPNSKRPTASHSASHGSGSAPHEHGTRRNQTNSAAGANAGSNPSESSRAYRNSHAYVVSQQPLFTSWNLPDYLAHLEEMLPSDTPRPLEVPSGSGLNPGNVNGGRGESLDRTVERGVKVKWPSKRTSVGDMNKRVRALVEWVGREQAAALDRMRRRDALEKALREETQAQLKRRETERGSGDPAAMLAGLPPDPGHPVTESRLKLVNYDTEETQRSSATMKMMEELMEELIGFQERFGPAAKSRERRPAPS